jgi:hypothetical protein
MKKLAVAAIAALTMTLTPPEDPAPEPVGYGSCYEVQPICMNGRPPICVCDLQNYCFWACR